MDDDEERARARQLATVLHLAKKDPARYDFRSLLYGRADMAREVVLLQTLSRGRGSAKIGSGERGPLR